MDSYKRPALPMVLTDSFLPWQARCCAIGHYDPTGLEEELQKVSANRPNMVMAAVDGVDGFAGVVAPLDPLHGTCRSHGALLIVDDAHGLRILGERGRGTAEQFKVPANDILTAGSLGKALAALQLLEEEPWRRRRICDLSRRLREEAKKLGYDVGERPHAPHPVKAINFPVVTLNFIRARFCTIADDRAGCAQQRHA